MGRRSSSRGVRMRRSNSGHHAALMRVHVSKVDRRLAPVDGQGGRQAEQVERLADGVARAAVDHPHHVAPVLARRDRQLHRHRPVVALRHLHHDRVVHPVTQHEFHPAHPNRNWRGCAADRRSAPISAVRVGRGLLGARGAPSPGRLVTSW